MNRTPLTFLSLDPNPRKITACSQNINKYSGAGAYEFAYNNAHYVLPGRGKMNKNFFIYILASQKNGTLYIGVTSDLIKRIWEHKESLVDGFTKKYNVKKLVYYEQHQNAQSAIQREKRLKTWKRKWKLELIEKINPRWIDLYDGLLG